jgi:hypothetical protein
MSRLYASDAVKRWIALLDAAELLRQSAQPHDPAAMRRAGRAIDSLFRFEHLLTDDERERARRTVWQRDKVTPLPSDTSEWQHCRCMTCRLAREGLRVQIDRSLFQPQEPPVAIPEPQPQPEQGVLLPC